MYKQRSIRTIYPSTLKRPIYTNFSRPSSATSRQPAQPSLASKELAQAILQVQELLTMTHLPSSEVLTIIMEVPKVIQMVETSFKLIRCT